MFFYWVGIVWSAWYILLELTPSSTFLRIFSFIIYSFLILCTHQWPFLKCCQCSWLRSKSFLEQDAFYRCTFSSFFSTGVTGRALLTVMAFDWYIAICNPPAVHTIMTRQYCILLIFASWGFGAFMVLPTTIWATQLPYCRPNIVRHMFCSHFSVVSLSIYTTRNGFWSLTNALIAIYRMFLIILI